MNRTISKTTYIELKKHYISGACQGIYTAAQCAEALQLTPCRIFQLKKQFRKIGENAFIHGNSQKRPHNKFSQNKIDSIISAYQQLLTTDTPISSPTFNSFQKLFLRYFNINASYSQVYKILNNAGFKSPVSRKKITSKPVHLTRARRRFFGELVQFDASEYNWCNDGNVFALHGGIDDATGKILSLHGCIHECFYGYGAIFTRIGEKYGLFSEAYVDGSSVFFVNPSKKKYPTIKEQLEGAKVAKTEMRKILDSLGIIVHRATSPEAKGRIERLWATLQSVLPVWCTYKKIKSMDELNAKIEEFIQFYNDAYAVQAFSPELKFRKIPTDKNWNEVFSYCIERKTNSAGIFTIHGYECTIEAPRRSHQDIVVMISDTGVFARLKKDDGKRYRIRSLEPIQNVIGDTMPQVLQDIFYRYLYDDSHSLVTA